MQLSSAPAQIQLPFGSDDSSKTNPIPVASQIPVTAGRASFTDGFPPLNATPVTSGGVPPFKSDMNGLLYMLSGIDLWMSAGAGFSWSSDFATAVGGYPKGARVLNAIGSGYWLSTVDNNLSDPDTGGAGWIATWKAAAAVYASAQQTLATGNSKVLWDTVESDPQNLWDESDKRFVAIWGGLYRMHGSIYLPSAGAQNLAVMIYKNGTLAKLCNQFPQVSDVPLSYHFDASVECAEGDYLEAFMNIPDASVLAGQVGSNQAYVFGQIEFLGS